MARRGINPKTGKRYAWEEEQAAKHAETIEAAEIQKQIGLLKRQQKVLAARDDLLEFSEFIMPDPAAPNDVDRTLYEATRFHREVAKALEAVERGEIQQLIFAMPPRHGKSIAHDQPILTPRGWRKHGDLRVGDTVFGPDGQPTEVIGLSADVDEVVPVTFSNGEVVRCHLNHEWTVFDRSAGRWRTLETRDIAARTLRNGPEGRGGRWTLQLPDTPCLVWPETELPVDPYVLGAWLGDGNAQQARIAHAPQDEAVVEGIEAAGFKITNRFTQESTGVCYAQVGGLRGHLRRMGVLDNKHVPETYLRASVAQRLSLLAGLVDTDGHVERGTGRVRFSTCSEALRDGVYDLALTLGFRPYVVEVQPATSSSGIVGRKVTYQVGFQPTMEIPTRLERKATKVIAKRRRVGVVSVGPVETGGARSIQVQREDGLYVVGRHCVVTHNTQLATKNFAAWLSGRHPEWNIAVASYSDTMAEDMGADTRAIMTGNQFRQVFTSHKLRRGGTSKSNVQTERGGRLVFVGRGGALTGRGADALLIDDLYKDFEEARSQTIRDQAWNWFTKVAMTRRMGKKLVVITMTRWHSDDIVGRITDPENPCYNAVEAKKWKIIRLPAIAEEDDPLGRAEGEVLWPERFDMDFLQSQQRLDAMGFAALYQQRPTVADGVLFRRETIQMYQPDELPADLRIYCASDHAVATGQRNDYTVMFKVGVDRQNNIWVLDCFRAKVSSDKAVEAMLAMASGKDRPLLWWAERGHISKSIGPFLRKRMLETGTYINIVEVTPATDKEQRAQSIVARVAMGKVYFPAGKLWTEKVINEMLAFPNGLHDDAVDALAYIGLGLQSQFAPGRDHAKDRQAALPKFGTLAWVKLADKWADEKRAQVAAGGF